MFISPITIDTAKGILEVRRLLKNPQTFPRRQLPLLPTQEDSALKEGNKCKIN